jgi:type I restriction enzyme, R subunit
MTRHPTESQTRETLIDPALRKAGWDVDDPDLVRIEIPVDGFDPAAWKALDAKLRHLKETGVPYDVKLPKGICDYALYRPNGEIIAIVEAKRTSVDSRLAEPQVEFYVTEIAKRQSFQPFGFATNGRDIYFHDVGRAPKRLVYGFFSPSDLENLLYLRQNQKPFESEPPDLRIADRPYQLEAIRRVCEAFERGRRKTLLVMATGAGKTRAAMSLVDVFLRTNQARRILFVADRDALVQQALDDGFKAFIEEPSTRIYTGDIDTTKRLFVVTLQTLNNCFREFTPGFFDLIIFDEVHRSIFYRWKEPLQYFDGRMIGLTATPADFIDRNTFLAFECYDGLPTFLYSYEQAIADDYLVDYVPYVARTKYQRTGIRGEDLSEEERNLLIEQGIDPDELDYSGTDLEVKVTNRDTLRQQWQEIMDVCHKDPAGLPGKTIVFALTQEHALRLHEVFEEMYPHYPDLARVITYQTKYARREIKKFKTESKPRIALSVDMLETGIDVPEAVNLVFMRPVRSRIKLEQMIGRGTRCQAACKHLEWLPDGEKNDFLIVDFWENNFRKDAQEVVAQSLPVLVSLFNTRLKLLERYLDDQESPDVPGVIAALRAQIARIPTEAIPVKKVWPRIERAWQDDFWRYLTPTDVVLLRDHVGPLLRYAPDVDVAAETFTHKVERLKLQAATGADTAGTARAIAEDVRRIPSDFVRDPQGEAALDLCLAPRRLQRASVDELNQIIESLAGLMKKRKKVPSPLLELDLPDEIELRGYLLLQGMDQPVYAEEYRRRVEDWIVDLAAGHPTVEAIARGEPVSDDQLLDLERTLRRRLSGPEFYLTENNIRIAYKDQGLQVGSLIEFLRYLLDLDGIPDYAALVQRQFAQYIADHPFTADQTRFLRAVQTIFLQKKQLTLADLYEPPLTHFGQDAVERWFTQEQIDDILTFTTQLTVGVVDSSQ